MVLTLLQPALPAPAGSSWPGSERLIPAVGLVEKPNQLQGSSQGPDVQSHSAGAEAARAQLQQLALAPSIAGGGARDVWELPMVPKGDGHGPGCGGPPHSAQGRSWAGSWGTGERDRRCPGLLPPWQRENRPW